MTPRHLGIEDLTRIGAALAASPADRALETGLKLLAEYGIHRDAVGQAAPWLEVQVGGQSLRLFSRQAVADDLTEVARAFLTTSLTRVSEQLIHRVTHERMTLLSSASFEGLMIHVDGHVIDSNDRLAELLGCTPEEARGDWPMKHCVAPEDLPGVVQRMASGYEGSYVITGVRKDGSRFRAELQSKQGKLGERPVRVAAVRDVTEREQMLTLLRERDEQLRQLRDAIFDVTVSTRGGMIIDVRGNAERLLGYPPEMMVGKHASDFVAPSSTSIVREAIAKQTVGAYRATALARDGSLVPIEVVAVNCTEVGLPTRIVGLRDLRDVTRLESERLQLEQQVARSQRLQSLEVLAGGVAHDFNNLLVGILGNADFLLSEVLEPAHREALEEITGAATRAGQLTSRLLTYAGRSSMGPSECVELGPLVQELERLVRPSLSFKANIKLQVSGECSVMGSRATLSQVLINLLTNASEALEDEPGEICIGVQPLRDPGLEWDDALGARVGPGQWVLIEVSDTGIGMTPGVRARLFEPFYTTKRGGQGLGLAACLGIVSAHAGAIRVQSEPGAGSRFSILLPAPHRDDVAPVTARGGPAPCHVLLVDDEAIVRAQMRRSLELRGFTVSEAENGRVALALLAQGTFDLMIVDMRMPVLDGADVVSTVRQSNLVMPIVVASGYMDPHTERRLRPDSFQAFLRKPYSVEELLGAITQAQLHPMQRAAS